MLSLTLTPSLNQGFRLLCLGAHCDDIEIGCGATILQLLRSTPGADVRWVVFSSDDRRLPEAQRSAGRFLEHAAHRTIEIETFRDGYFPYIGAAIKDKFEAIKNSFVPDLVLTHYRDDRHQDHRLISELTWNTFRDHLILEYEIPKFDGDFSQPNFFVPASEFCCQNKTDLLLEEFVSQRDKPWFSRDLFLAVLRLRGMEANSPTGYAEGFYCRKGILGGLAL